ncbi:hypothetical protein TNCV_705601 [Trichonephila clavipes]|nr:hypothetical protein TNCV_705601 [Trichonephila clavipes]
MGRTNPAGKTVADEVRSLMKELPCKLQYDWSRPINAETAEIVPPSGGRKGKAEARHRTIESEEVTLPNSDRGDRCFEKDIKSATLGAELGITS